VGGIVGRLADLGFSMKGGYQSEQSKGVLQKDLITAILSGNNCRLQVFQTLEKSLLGEHPIRRGEPKVGTNAGMIFVDAQDNIFAATLRSIPNLPGGGGLPPVSIPVTPGDTITLSATGIANCCGGNPAYNSGPDGLTNPFGTDSSITNDTGSSVSNFYHNLAFPLVGVFTGLGNSFALGHIFVVGSRYSGVAPAGATTLYLGLPDANAFNGPAGYYGDNTGGFAVTYGITVLMSEPR
jgi:hypothetical protein